MSGRRDLMVTCCRNREKIGLRKRPVEMWNLLAEILLLICTAFVLGALAQRFKQSPILGYLMA